MSDGHSVDLNRQASPVQTQPKTICNRYLLYASFILLVLLSGCQFPALLPSGSAGEVSMSPSGRFFAQPWLCCAEYSYVVGFIIYDSHTGHLQRQNVRSVERLSEAAGGRSFQWTPTDNYLVIETDNMATSHGCDELLVYTGDGSSLVYNSALTSICNVLSTDRGLSIFDLCQNDDILYTYGGLPHYLLTPSTGTILETDAQTCGELDR